MRRRRRRRRNPTRINKKLGISMYPFFYVNHPRYGMCIALKCKNGERVYQTINQDTKKILKTCSREEKLKLLEPLITAYEKQ